jgi:signal transduction histidine kinase
MSVRLRTTVAATLIFALALGTAAFGLLVLQRRAMLEHLDDVADVRASGVAALVDDGTLPRDLSVASEDDEFVRVVDDARRVVAQTPGWTTAERRVTSARATGATVYVATSVEPVDDAISSLRRAVAFGGPALLATVAAVTWLVTGRALRPVERIRVEVAEISERSLDRRVPVPGTRDEVARLATTMNTMLDRLEQGAERQRRFVADASHELRTPVAAVITDLEVAAAHPDPAASEETTTDVLATLRRLGSLVDDLLVLARVDGAPVRAAQAVDLDDVVREEAVRSRRPVDVTGVQPATVLGSRDDLARVVRNLLDNAARHAADRIEVTLAADAGDVVLTVVDDGAGIPEAMREAVFERFTRADAVRDRTTGGTGLGLAIVREIITAHGGSVAVEDGRGAVLRVRLPSAEVGAR